MNDFLKKLSKNPRIKALFTIFKNLINIASSVIAIIFALPLIFVSLVLPKKLVNFLNKGIFWLTKIGTKIDELEKVE